MSAATTIFVNRRAQLALFDELLAALEQGDQRHLALLGLRRIGKTMLLDEVRVRHPGKCMPKLPLDVVVSTPEDFALEMMATVLEAACYSQGIKRKVTTQETSITAAAALLGEAVVPSVEEIVDLLGRASYGRLIPKTLLFPWAVSEALDLPMLVILDEFQSIRKIQNFKNTDNLWAALREALDRRGRVAFVIAGSVVTLMRQILHEGNDPLFTRFREVELPPFEEPDTHELAAGLWERGGMTWTQNAVQRLHALSQGFPFYAHTLALAAADQARPATSAVDGDHVDAAFQTEMLDPNRTLSIYCQYLYQQAIGDVRGENIPDAILRHLAAAEGSTRTDMARAVRRSEGRAQVNRVIDELVRIDVLASRDGRLWFVDPVLPIWTALERERRDPAAVLHNPQARAKVIHSYEERLQGLQEAMGKMFEKRVHNILRQFRGQVVSGKLFGAADRRTLPVIGEVHNVELPDPEGKSSGEPGSVEIDAIAPGSETWAVECKHRAGGATVAQVAKFLRACEFYEEKTSQRIDRRWYISQTGFRSEAREKCLTEGIYFSTIRDLQRLERAVAHRD